MNFKKFFPIIMLCCLTGAYLSAMQKFTFDNLDNYSLKKGSHSWIIEKTGQYHDDSNLALHIMRNIVQISNLEKDISRAQRTTTWVPLIIGGIAGIASAALSHTCVLKKFNPLYQGIGAATTFLTTALLGYGITRKILTRHSRMEMLRDWKFKLDQYSEYLPTVQTPQTTKGLIIDNASESRKQSPLNPVAARVHSTIVEQCKQTRVYDV